MRITETFQSIQGEGPAMGVPCFFIRFAGCNLRCRWCDTPRSSWKPEGIELSVDELLIKAIEHPGRAVVITGGEPFIHPEFPALCKALRAQGNPVHLETAGTVFVPVEADLVCISPKMKGSAPDALEFPELHAKHESLRHNPTAIRQFIAQWPQAVYFKFVVEQVSDLRDIYQFLDEVKFHDRSRILLMAQSRTPEDLRNLAPQVAEWCVQEGFRYSDRLHVRLWGNEAGR